jgi:hypothetical protein
MPPDSLLHESVFGRWPMISREKERITIPAVQGGTDGDNPAGLLCRSEAK